MVSLSLSLPSNMREVEEYHVDLTNVAILETGPRPQYQRRTRPGLADESAAVLDVLYYVQQASKPLTCICSSHRFTAYVRWLYDIRP